MCGDRQGLGTGIIEEKNAVWGREIFFCSMFLGDIFIFVFLKSKHLLKSIKLPVTYIYIYIYIYIYECI